MMPSITGLDFRSAFLRRTVKRLTRSTREVTLAVPNSLRNWIRSLGGLTRRHWRHGPASIPAAKFLAGADGFRTMLDRQFISEFMGLTAPLAAAAPASAMLGQVSPQVDRVAVLGIGELIDGLMADLEGAAFQAQTAGDLLRGPAGLEPVDDHIAKVSVPDQLAQTSAAAFTDGLGSHGIIARQVLQLGIDEAIALQLAVDRGAVTAEMFRDLQDRHFGVVPVGYSATVFQAEMDIRAGHANPPLSNTLLLLKSRTSILNPPIKAMRRR